MYKESVPNALALRPCYVAPRLPRWHDVRASHIGADRNNPSEVCGRQGSGRLVGVALKYSKVLSWPLTSKQSVLRLEVAEHWYRLYKTDNQGVPQSGSTSTPFWQPRKPHAPIYALRLCSLHLVPPSRPLDRHGLNYSNSSLQVFFFNDLGYHFGAETNMTPIKQCS
uniref:Uncharacterized protein n=1 Tax=Oryza nivara TaxID=4536 RepID=A0A0E0IQQ5_ORYNI